MDINTLFPSDYLKAADVVQPRVMTIKAITREEIGQDRTLKPVLHFHEDTRGLVLNKTNAAMIAHTYGNQTDNWVGRPVELHVEPVSFQGKIVDAIRVRVPPQGSTPLVAQRVVAPIAAPSSESLVVADIDF